MLTEILLKKTVMIMTSKKWECYEVSGDKLDNKKKYCPKCGPGVFMAHHDNRLCRGKCGYTEFKKN